MLPILLAGLEREEDKVFFTLFYEKYKLELYRFALSILRDPVLAEEAVQEGWMKCVKYADSFFAVPPPERRPWMTVMLRRVCYTILKQEARHTSLEEDWDAPAPEEGAYQDIVEIIRSMPEQYRTILELKLVLEWSNKAIAKEVGLPVTTVNTRISRGRKLLQDILIEEGYYHGKSG